MAVSNQSNRITVHESGFTAGISRLVLLVSGLSFTLTNSWGIVKDFFLSLSLSLSEVLLEVLDTAATRAGILERIFQQSRRILIGGSEEKGGGGGWKKECSSTPERTGGGA